MIDAFDVVRHAAEVHHFDDEWIEGLENLRCASGAKQVCADCKRVIAPLYQTKDGWFVCAECVPKHLSIACVSDIAAEQREAWAQKCCGTTTGVHHDGCLTARGAISGTPATMLGEALAALGRTILLAEQSGCCSPHGATLNGLHGARSALEDLKRLADAREGR